MESRILAIVTLNMDHVAGGAPIFFAPNPEEQEKMARTLARTLDATVHILPDGTYFIVRH